MLTGRPQLDPSMRLPDTNRRKPPRIAKFEAGIPKMPKEVRDDLIAASKWRELVRLLSPRNMLTVGDSNFLSVCAFAFSRYEAARRQYGQTKSADDLDALTKCERVWFSYQRELGLTPASRAKVIAAPKADSTPEQDLRKRMDALRITESG